MRNNGRITIVLASLMVLSLTWLAYAQDEEEIITVTEEVSVAPAPASAAGEPKEIAIYGEVQAVDTAAGSMAVQYYDYDSDSEKTATVIVDKDSKIENSSALGDIKKGDWADVTYVEKDGKNVAKVVTVEKEEMPPAGSPAAGDEDVMPEDE